MTDAAARDSGLPRPPALNYLTAVGVLYVCLQILAVVLETAIVDGHPMAIIACGMFPPLFVPLMWQQYRGTFFGFDRGATWAGRILYGIGIFLFFGYASNVAEAMQKYHKPLAEALYGVWGLAAAALPPLLAGRSNQLRARALREAYARDSELRPHRTITMSHVFGGIALLSVVLGVTVYQQRVRGPRYAEHVAASSVPFAMPAEATDVCYARSWRSSLAYEFTIDEAGFRDWATQHFDTSGTPGRQLREIRDPQTNFGDCSISRYVTLVSGHPGDRHADVTDGLCFVRHFQDTTKQAVYDRSSKRAYFFRY